MPAAVAPSKLLLEEYYSAEDARFVELLRDASDPHTLAALTNRWLADPKPWARAQIQRYLALPFDRPGHAVVVKRLFKHAEKSVDDALMAAFMAAFDCLVRRVRKKRWHWDSGSRSSYETEELVVPRNSYSTPVRKQPPENGWARTPDAPYGKNRRLFSYRTRYYLQRRAWRYFRRMGWQRPDSYVKAVCGALHRYQEDDFKKGENLLDSWGFMHACFGGHGALLFTAHRTKLKDGKTLGDLTPAPSFAKLWQSAAGLNSLSELALNAPARPVRVWAVRLIASPEMAAAGPLAFDDLRRLLQSTDDDVQSAAVKLLENCADTARWTVPQWLSLLEVPGHTVLGAVTAMMSQQVRPDRLDAAQCMALACSRPVPVARMGFDFLKRKALSAAEMESVLPKAAAALCAAVAPDLTAWCLDRLATGDYNREHLSVFCDSLLAETRMAAWDWLGRHQDSPAWNDAVLWSRLAETPFDDLRLKLVDTLAVRAALPCQDARDLAPVWTSVLLGVHRGGRQKLKAVHQIAAAVRADESLAGSLLSVLAVAVRSIRGPERRAGLAAVVGLATGSESLDAAVRLVLPELQFSAVA